MDGGNVRKYMVQNLGDHLDPRTDLVNDTALAEDACSHFNGYIDGDQIPEEYFDLARQVAWNYEMKLQQAAAGLK